MSRSKATITLDREKVDEARSLAGLRSMSEVVDVALDRFLRELRTRRDVEAYRRRPPTEDEKALGTLAVTFDLGDDDVDYEALYADDSPSV